MHEGAEQQEIEFKKWRLRFEFEDCFAGCIGDLLPAFAGVGSVFEGEEGADVDGDFFGAGDESVPGHGAVGAIEVARQNGDIGFGDEAAQAGFPCAQVAISGECAFGEEDVGAIALLDSFAEFIEGVGGDFFSPERESVDKECGECAGCCSGEENVTGGDWIGCCAKAMWEREGQAQDIDVAGVIRNHDEGRALGQVLEAGYAHAVVDFHPEAKRRVGEGAGEDREETCFALDGTEVFNGAKTVIGGGREGPFAGVVC